MVAKTMVLDRSVLFLGYDMHEESTLSKEECSLEHSVWQKE